MNTKLTRNDIQEFLVAQITKRHDISDTQEVVIKRLVIQPTERADSTNGSDVYVFYEIRETYGARSIPTFGAADCWIGGYAQPSFSILWLQIALGQV